MVEHQKRGKTRFFNMKRIGKSPVAKMKHEADRAMQVWFVRTHPKCECCGQPTYCAHHIVEKPRSSALRYEGDNLVAVCLPCHSQIHNQMFGRPANNSLRSYNLIDGIIERRGGKKWKDELECRGRMLVKTNLEFYKKAFEYFTNLIHVAEEEGFLS